MMACPRCGSESIYYHNHPGDEAEGWHPGDRQCVDCLHLWRDTTPDRTCKGRPTKVRNVGEPEPVRDAVGFAYQKQHCDECGREWCRIVEVP